MTTPEKSPFDTPQWTAMAEASQKAEDTRQARIAQHPDNGRAGWWIVSGLRHSARCRATTAAEAIHKAAQAGLVGTWECPEASFWTDELPDAF